MISRASSRTCSVSGGRSAGAGSTGLESSPVTAVPSALPGRALTSPPRRRSSTPLGALLCPWPSSRARSPVTPAHHRVERGDGRDDVGDHAALAHRGGPLQVDEAGVAHVHPPRSGAALPDHVVAQLPARRL